MYAASYYSLPFLVIPFSDSPVFPLHFSVVVLFRLFSSFTVLFPGESSLFPFYLSFSCTHFQFLSSLAVSVHNGLQLWGELPCNPP